MNLVQPDDPILLGKANQVEFPDRELFRIVARMFEVMFANQGCGLAAPQVGISLRMFVYGIKSMVGVIINPSIMDKSARIIDSVEGCLTFKGKLWRVRRHESITCEFYDLQGVKHTKQFTGLMGIVVQHETDHLDGILISQHGQLV